MIHAAHIINLARRPDKKSFMENQLSELKSRGCNIHFSFFEAIDGSAEMGEYQALDWHDPSTKKKLTRGEIGCALSHLTIWEKTKALLDAGSIRENHLVMVLEDDVVFCQGFYQRLLEILKEAPPFDLLYLHRKPFDYDREEVVSPRLRRPLRSYWTCGYLLTARGARILVDSGYRQGIIPVDEFLPLMYGSSINPEVDSHYREVAKIQALAVDPPLLDLKDGAFEDSETFHSAPHAEPKEPILTIVYQGETSSERYRRFVEWAKVYDLHVASELGLTYPQLLIDARRAPYCSVIPLASPREILKTINALPRPGKDLNIFFPGTTLCVLRTGKGCRVGLDSRFSRKLAVMIDDTTLIHFDHSQSRLIMSEDDVRPAFAICQGYSWKFQSIENYTGLGWHKHYGSPLPQGSDTPSVWASVLIAHNPRVLDIFSKINYPTEKIRLNVLRLEGEAPFYHAQYQALQEEVAAFLASDEEYFLFVDHEAQISRQDFLRDLINTRRRVVSPLITGDGTFRNFWGALNSNGRYLRSHDYLKLADRERKGVWHVPYVSKVILIERSVIQQLPSFYESKYVPDFDMSICQNLREAGVGIYLCNHQLYGRIVEGNPEIPQTLGDLSDDSANQIAWQEKYLHPEMLAALGSLSDCPFREIADGIYSFPLFSEAFCQELIAMAEEKKGWSAGRNNHLDKRIGDDYYENYPTVDTQLFQLGLEEVWKRIVDLYIAPVARHLYNNYKTRDINLAFVVRYRFDEQAKLSAHHDSSTYTINVALNSSEEYGGGGCRFIRQDIRVTGQPVGHCCIHPGRLTAYHEGLPVTSGTRYILVSFIN